MFVPRLKFVISAIGLTALAACATTTSVREKAPVVSLTITKPAEQYAGCVSERWQNHGVANITYTPNEGGVSLISSGPSGVELLLDIRKRGDRSAVSMYSRLVYGDSKLSKDVLDCAN